MGKIYALFIAGMISMNMLLAGTNPTCVIDTTNTAIFSPNPDSLPCIERTVYYNQAAQIKVPDSIDAHQFYSIIPAGTYFYVDSLVIDSVTGFPGGVNYYINPYWQNNVNQTHLYGNQNACVNISGTTNDSTGSYPIIFYGFIRIHGTIGVAPFLVPIDTTVKLQDLASVFNDSLSVINPGDSCRPQSVASGIKNFSSDLNTALSVYPNPNNGQFELKLNAGRRIAGEVVITDVTGRVIYTRPLDVIGYYDTSIDLSNFSKGLYTLQLRTADGFASKNISIE